MDLWILRHGTAQDHGTAAGGDFARELVPRGRDQARAAARLLKSLALLPDLVLSSPRIRARQTADEFCSCAEIAAPELVDWLDSGMHPRAGLAQLAAHREIARVMIVGHEPDLSILLRWCLGADAGDIEMKKGGLACIRIAPPRPGGTLRLVMPPKMLQHLPT